MRGLKTALATFLSLWLVLSSALAYDAAVVSKSERSLATFTAEITRIGRELQNPSLTEAQLSGLRNGLEDIRTASVEQAGILTAPLKEVTDQLASLGPAPAAGATEPAGIAEQRATLQAARDRLQSVKSRLDVLALEAEQLAGRISALQLDQFFQRIFQADRSIFNPQLWYDTSVGVGALLTRVTGLLKNWWQEVGNTANPIGLGLIPLFVALFITAFSAVSRWFSRWTDYQTAADRSPNDIARLWRIVLGQVSTLATLFILFTPIALALNTSGYVTPRFAVLQNALFSLTGGTFAYYMLARRLMAPAKPEWRVVDVDDKAAGRLVWMIGLTAFLSVANRRLIEVSDTVFLPLNYSIGQSAIMALAMLVLLSLILFTLRKNSGIPNPAGRQFYFKWASAFTPLAWFAIAIGFGALAFGYLALAAYIAQQLFRTAVLLAVLFLLHHLSDAAAAASMDSQSGFGRFFRRVTGWGERTIERVGLIFRIAVDLVLVAVGLPLLFLLWAVTWVDFRGLINSAVFGVKLGEITISPGSIAVILLVLAGGVVLTKLLVRWLDGRILSETRLDKGVQDSIRKGSSYAGYLLAAGFALSAAGLDLSNLAIVAGALGVGIGFGLQSIANNFISGLILLAERPIRVGDWVSVAAGEGLVKRINVRSTEIETFDNCSIIVPNSSLITEAVRNWTYGDTLARFSVAVTVTYGTNPEAVRELLLDIARQHPKVLSSPEPVVALMRFGQFGLDFEVRAYVADALDAFMTASDVRFTIISQFQEKAITIPSQFAIIQQDQT